MRLSAADQPRLYDAAKDVHSARRWVYAFLQILRHAQADAVLVGTRRHRRDRGPGRP